jgi:hypothetical protein
MVLPKTITDVLIQKGLAVHTTPAKSTLADETTKDFDAVVINLITVNGRVLRDIVATAVPTNTVPLLGLGALNRLGPYSINDGKIVFSGEPP